MSTNHECAMCHAGEGTVQILCGGELVAVCRPCAEKEAERRGTLRWLARIGQLENIRKLGMLG